MDFDINDIIYDGFAYPPYDYGYVEYLRERLKLYCSPDEASVRKDIMACVNFWRYHDISEFKKAPNPELIREHFSYYFTTDDENMFDTRYTPSGLNWEISEYLKVLYPNISLASIQSLDTPVVSYIVTLCILDTYNDTYGLTSTEKLRVELIENIIEFTGDDESFDVSLREMMNQSM